MIFWGKGFCVVLCPEVLGWAGICQKCSTDEDGIGGNGAWGCDFKINQIWQPFQMVEISFAEQRELYRIPK